jgi:hypothetical protein
VKTLSAIRFHTLSLNLICSFLTSEFLLLLEKTVQAKQEFMFTVSIVKSTVWKGTWENICLGDKCFLLTHKATLGPQDLERAIESLI